LFSAFRFFKLLTQAPTIAEIIIRTKIEVNVKIAGSIFFISLMIDSALSGVLVESESTAAGDEGSISLMVLILT
jgi:hypothetical protein